MENIERDKLRHRDDVFYGLVIMDVIFLAGKVPVSQNGWVVALIFLLLVTLIYMIVKRMRRK